MPDLNFYIEGEHAEATAAALADLLQAEFGRVPQRQPALPPATDTRADPLAVVAIVLALPGAIDAGLNLAKRLDLQQRLQRLAGFAREQRRSRGDRIWVKRSGRIEPVLLDDARLDKLLSDESSND